MVEPALEPGCIGNPQYDFKTSPKHENLEIPVAGRSTYLVQISCTGDFREAMPQLKQINFCSCFKEGGWGEVEGWRGGGFPE